MVSLPLVTVATKMITGIPFPVCVWGLIISSYRVPVCGSVELVCFLINGYRLRVVQECLFFLNLFLPQTAVFLLRHRDITGYCFFFLVEFISCVSITILDFARKKKG